MTSYLVSLHCAHCAPLQIWQLGSVFRQVDSCAGTHRPLTSGE